MAGVESSENPVFSLRLLVDKKRSKVVLAEAGKEFVNVLFSFLTLPMGTIVRLLEKYQQDQKSQAASIGCFNNLYKSVFDLGIDNFLCEASKHILLYPRSVHENKCRRLKLNIDDTEVLKYYRCPNLTTWSSCSRVYSNLCSSRCHCGALMGKEFKGQGVTYEDIFVSEKTSFTITDNMKVGFTSMGLTLKTLQEFGYTDVDQLHEMLVDVNHEKVLALLQCLFSSDTPLTDAFLLKRSSRAITKVHNLPSLAVQEVTRGSAEPNEGMVVSVFTRKLDRKVLYIECGKDFVDLLCTFLVLPLNSGINIMQGCIDNLCESFKSLSSSDGRNALTDKCLLPWYYSCQGLLLDVGYAERDRGRSAEIGSGYKFLKPIDPRCNSESRLCTGFVKRELTFMVTDDLIITPMNFSLTICTLKKWNMDLDDIEEHVIKMSKTAAIRLLQASLMTSTALNTVFGSLLSKKPKQEKL